jgi:hypothetical protein
LLFTYVIHGFPFGLLKIYNLAQTSYD